VQQSTPLITTSLVGSKVLGSLELGSWSKLRLRAVEAAALVVCISLWNAWICDDAFITFRVADNVLSGFGPRWNVDERVQAYSNPLWLLLFLPVYAVVGSPYVAAVMLAVLCTTAALLLFARGASSSQLVTLGMAVCMTSKAFIDYSTSGLENPASYALLAALAGCIGSYPASAGQPHFHLFFIALICGLLALNRLDGVILALPTLLWAASRVRSVSSAIAITSGLIPLIAWLVFGTVYYGFPFPNTAYAKLDNGWPSIDLFQQGLRYLFDSLTRDPVTLSTVAFATWTAFIKPSLLRLLFVAGAVLHLVYVVKIGGDFMSGRFLTAPFFAAILSLVVDRPTIEPPLTTPFASSWQTRFLLGLVILGAVSPSSPVVNAPWWRSTASPFDLSAIGPTGICDERAFYYPSCGLARLLFCGNIETNPLIEQGADWRAKAQANPATAHNLGVRAFCAANMIGYAGFYAGPLVHVFDRMALSDAFLARLPPKGQRQRIGHIERIIPDEYINSRITNSNQFTDKSLARLYDDIMLIISGRLFSADRWRAIVRRNIAVKDWF
jgi:arabinofuranosyltransferase